MRDRLFTGGSVTEALATAAQILGLPQRELRYVVIEEGQAGGRGLQATPARVAVLLHEGPTRAAAAQHERPSAAPPREQAVPETRAGIREVVRAVGEAAGVDLTCEIEEQASALHVELRGDGCKTLYGKDADGEPLRALEHLLLRMYGEAIRPQALRLRCEGFREIREVALGERARRLAEQVRETGEPWLLEPMNAYERRLVHVALQEEPGVRTTSIGEGSARRVQIVPVDAREATAEAQDRASEGSDAH